MDRQGNREKGKGKGKGALSLWRGANRGHVRDLCRGARSRVAGAAFREFWAPRAVPGWGGDLTARIRPRGRGKDNARPPLGFYKL